MIEYDLTLRETLSLSFMVIGTLFMTIAALGLLRMPDIFLRMSMSTKSATFGVGWILLSAIVYFIDDLGTVTRAAATILFILLTAPVSAHMIGRAAYVADDRELWEGTSLDMLAKYYASKEES